MNFKTAYETLESKFISGNNIPVERNTITREEWEAIKKEIQDLQESKELFNLKYDILLSETVEDIKKWKI